MEILPIDAIVLSNAIVCVFSFWLFIMVVDAETFRRRTDLLSYVYAWWCAISFVSVPLWMCAYIWRYAA